MSAITWIALAALCLFGAGWVWSLRLIRATLSMPTERIEVDGPRPWLMRLLPYSRFVRTILSDIERLKQSEFDHQTRYKILTDNVAAAVIIHQPDGTVLWCSPYTEVLTGFALGEIYASRASFLTQQVHEDDRGIIENSLAIVATGEPFQCRYRVYHKSGMLLWFETRTVPVFDHEANEYVALAITLDVTASVMSQLKVEERNRDLNEFTYMISHDLKAPIVTMRGMLGLLREECEKFSASETEEPLRYMEKAIYRLEQLVGGVLELARVSAADKALEPVHVGETVEEVLEDLKLDIDRCDASVTTVSELPWVLGNRRQLYQIVSNLVANALKYRQPDRPLVITIGEAESKSRRRVSFSISDNGRGIEQDLVEGIFKPFNRAGEETIEGSGVGLACVRKLVEKFGGSISVSSTPSQGTVFTVELRRAPDHPSSHG